MAATVTVCGSAAQSVPYQSAQPPAAWQSLQVPVTSTAGDWMIAVVAWRQQAGGQGATVHVGDDTMRNYWQPLAQPVGTSLSAGVVRIAVWTAPAAQAAQYVTVAPTETVQGLACMVLDVSGMLPWQTLSGYATTANNSATTLATLATAAPASQALVITAGCNDLDTVGFGPAGGAGWTSLGFVNASNGTDHTADIGVATYYQVTTGATSAAWTATGTADLAGVIAALLVSGTAPTQASTYWPNTVAELAPGCGPGTPEDQRVWTPVTARSLQLQAVTQGAQYNLAALTSATGTVTFDNPDGALIAGQPVPWQVQWTGNGSTNFPFAQSALQSATVGVTYTFTAFLGSSSPWVSGQYLQFDWQGSGGHISYTTSPIVTGTGPQLVVLNGIAPTGTTGFYIGLVANQTPPASITFHALAAAVPSVPGAVSLPSNVTWTAGNSATVITLAPWLPGYAGIDSGTPFRVRQVWQGGAWQVNFHGNGSAGSPQIDSGSIFTVTPGVTYSISALLACSTPWASGVTLNLIFKNAGFTIVGTATSAAVTGTTATAATATGTAPATATQASVFITAAGTPPAFTFFLAAAAPLTGAAGSLTIPPGVAWAAENSATSTILAAWTPDLRGAPQISPYGVPFAGYIRTWPQGWDQNMLRGTTQAAITDAWAYCNGNLQPILLQEILNDNPYAYWPCIDAAGSTQASNYGTGNGTGLAIVQAKNGSVGVSNAFGGNSTALLGAQGTYLLTSSVRAQTQAGMWGLAGTSNGSPPEGYSLTAADTSFPPVSGGVTIELFFQTTSPYSAVGQSVWMIGGVAQPILQIFMYNNGAGGTLGYQYTGSSGGINTIQGASSTNYCNGQLVHLAFSFTQTAWTSYIDGVQAGTGTFSPALPARFDTLTVNGICGTTSPQGAFSVFDSMNFNGYAGHVAVFAGQLTPERIMTHYQAGVLGMAGDSADARIERLLQAGAFPGRRVILQDTGTNITPSASCQDIASQPAATSITNIAASNVPGVLAIAPTGDITWLTRTYCYNQPARWVIGQNTSNGEIPYLNDLATSYDPLRVINDVQLTQLDNQDIVTPQPPVSALDAASQVQYGDQAYWVTGYLENDLLSSYSAGPGLIELANWIGNVNALPSNRIGQVTVDAASNPSAWLLFMTAAKGDIATVNIRPVTAPGVVLTVSGRISQTTRDLQWSLDAQPKATIQLLIDIAPEEAVLTADDPVRGQLTGAYPLAW